jgi:hypothetical protein
MSSGGDIIKEFQHKNTQKKSAEKYAGNLAQPQTSPAPAPCAFASRSLHGAAWQYTGWALFKMHQFL